MERTWKMNQMKWELGSSRDYTRGLGVQGQGLRTSEFWVQTFVLGVGIFEGATLPQTNMETHIAPF